MADYPSYIQSRSSVPSFPSTAFSITPSNTIVFPRATSIYVNSSGTVVVEPFGNTEVIMFSSLSAGMILPVMVKRVLAATTASCIGLQ